MSEEVWSVEYVAAGQPYNPGSDEFSHEGLFRSRSSAERCRRDVAKRHYWSEENRDDSKRFWVFHNQSITISAMRLEE